MAKKKPKKFDIPTEIRRLARERVGAPPSPKLIMPKKQQEAQAQTAGRRRDRLISILS